MSLSLDMTQCMDTCQEFSSSHYGNIPLVRSIDFRFNELIGEKLKAGAASF